MSNDRWETEAYTDRYSVIDAESLPIEKASIDEAYLDFTQPVRDLILERNPHLASVPQTSSLGLDTPLPDPPEIEWDSLGNIVPVLSGDEEEAKAEGTEAENAAEGKGKVAVPSSSQVIKRPSDPVNAWSDYALSIGAELMQKCRREVLQQLGYTCSAGVARNKVRKVWPDNTTKWLRVEVQILAKLCSAYRKPNAQVSMQDHCRVPPHADIFRAI